MIESIGTFHCDCLPCFMDLKEMLYYITRIWIMLLATYIIYKYFNK